VDFHPAPFFNSFQNFFFDATPGERLPTDLKQMAKANKNITELVISFKLGFS
jgi:hypothetical protein